MARATPRLYGLVSLGLVVAHALAALAAVRAGGSSFDALAPWPLGGGAGDGGLALRATALALALVLGWGVPGISLALWSDARLRGAALLGRGLGLGCAYILATGLAHATLTGHAPDRAAFLLLLALPPLGLTLRRGASEALDAAPLVALAIVLLLTGLLWGKLHDEGMNGDGTEAYELARSLDTRPMPHWDLERWEGPGRFGTPAVNPFVTNSYLAHGAMAVLGRGELAARLPLVPAVVILALLAGGRLARSTASGWLYVGAAAGVYLLWNAYYVGYEPPFTDLAEPAASDTLMTALWLAGFGELAAGSAPLGVAFLVLASGVLYSAPLLATAGLATLALAPAGPGRRALGLWLAAGAVVVLAALVYGAATGDLGDWIRQVRSEYWNDLISHDRRTPSLPLLAQLLLLTGALPLVAVVRAPRLSVPSRALLAASGVYFGLVVVSSFKNLHYLAPLPFLLAPPAIEAAGPRLRVAASAIILGAFGLSWPSHRAIHRETPELGRVSCVDGLGYEPAALAADVVYDAFDRPGRAGRLAVGKHTFVRYALDLGGTGCLVRLSPVRREGWIAVAGSEVTLSVRDVDAYVRWRFTTPSAPSSWLFRRVGTPALTVDASAWIGRHALDSGPGQALVVESFRDGHARLLVPAPFGASVALWTRAARSLGLGLSVNGRPAGNKDVPPGRERLPLASGAPPWRPGWNVLELTVEMPAAGLALEVLEVGPSGS